MASMSIHEMRKEIIKAYGGYQQWRNKVNAMPDNQIVAFYRNLTKRTEQGIKPIKRYKGATK